MLLIATGYAPAEASAPPSRVIWGCYLAIGLGTPFGGLRAETGGAIASFLATMLGIPVSTTHTITGTIVGVGSVRRAATERWGLAGNIVRA